MLNTEFHCPPGMHPLPHTTQTTYKSYKHSHPAWCAKHKFMTTSTNESVPFVRLNSRYRCNILLIASKLAEAASMQNVARITRTGHPPTKLRLEAAKFCNLDNVADITESNSSAASIPSADLSNSGFGGIGIASFMGCPLGKHLGARWVFGSV